MTDCKGHDMPRLGRWALALTVLLASILTCGAVESRDPEYRVKALFLYKSTHWIDWPESNLPESAKEIVIGVVGDDPFGDELDIVEKLKPVKGRKVRVTRLASIDKARDCQILFISDSLSSDDEKRALGLARDHGFVTVSERDRFADRGGMIHLVIVKNKLGFVANPGAAKKAEIKISSQLLKLAQRIVKEGE